MMERRESKEQVSENNFRRSEGSRAAEHRAEQAPSHINATTNLIGLLVGNRLTLHTTKHAHLRISNKLHNDP